MRGVLVVLLPALVACGSSVHDPHDAGTCEACDDAAPALDAGADTSVPPDAPVCEGLCEGDEWVRLFDPSDGMQQWGASIATDRDGNVFITGSVYTTSFGANSLAWLAKLAPNGELLWDRAMVGHPAGAVAVGPDGGVVTITESAGLVIRMFTADGELSWTRVVPELGPIDVAVADDGDVLVAGLCLAVECEARWALHRYQPDGDLEWAATSEAGSNELVHGVAVVGDEILLLGTGVPPGNEITYGAWVRKLDELGVELWRRDYPEDVAVSIELGGGFYVYGPVIGAGPDGGFAVGGGVRSDPPWGHDAWVTLLDREGEPRWAVRDVRPGVGEDLITGVAIASDGAVVTGASLWMDWDRGFSASVRELDVAGNVRWTRTYDGAGDALSDGDDGISDVAIDSTGAVLAVGASWPQGGSTDEILVLAYDAREPGAWDPEPSDCDAWLADAFLDGAADVRAAVAWIRRDEGSLLAFAPIVEGDAETPLDLPAATARARELLGADFDPEVIGFEDEDFGLALRQRTVQSVRLAVFTAGGQLAFVARMDLGTKRWSTTIVEPTTWKLRWQAPAGFCPEVALRGDGLGLETPDVLTPADVADALAIAARTPLPNLLLEAGATDVVGTVVGLDDNRDGEVMVVLWGVR